MTEKVLEACNDVFADIVNCLVFRGREKMLEDELEQGLERSVCQGVKARHIKILEEEPYQDCICRI